MVWAEIRAGSEFVFSHLIFINFILAMIIIFFQRKEPQSVWTWLLLLYFIPIFGFIFYLLVGTDMHKKRMFKIKEIEDHLNEAIRRQEDWLQDKRAGWKSPEIT